MFNDCIEMERVSKIWLKSRIVALLKPGKASNSHMYKLFEIILNGVALSVDDKLIKEMQVFDWGKVVRAKYSTW